LFASVGFLAVACTSSSLTVPDTTLPTVMSTGPGSAAIDVPRNPSVTATFSEAMDTSTLNGTTLVVMSGATVIPGAVTHTGTTATWTPTGVLAPNTLFTASVSTGAMDVAGNPLAAATVWSFTTVATPLSGPAAVDLGSAGNYVILASSGVSTTGATTVLGDIGLSPAAASFITGFALSAPPTAFTTSALVTGSIWASDYAPPTPANLTAAVLDMQLAYTDAAGRSLPDFTELGAGNVDGLTLTPGLYKWGTGLSIPAAVTLTGGTNDVWIFQVAQDLTVGNGAIVTLSGGARAQNVFWQVAGSATLGTTSNFKGIILSKTLIAMNTGTVMTGRALAQTAVTMDAVTIAHP
jgi:hypothetical protein